MIANPRQRPNSALVSAIAAAVCAFAQLGTATAAPKSVTCLNTVVLTYDDSRYQAKGELSPATGPCELALDATPNASYSVHFLSLGGPPKDVKKMKKMTAVQRLQILANQLAGGNQAAPVQDVETVGVFALGFSVARGPSGGLAASHIACTLVGKALLYVVLTHSAGGNPQARPFDRVAARNEILSILAGVRLGPVVGKG